MVSCDTTTIHPTRSAVLRYCAALPNTGANPRAIRTWVDHTFSTFFTGQSAGQDRSGAHWVLGVNKYGSGPGLTYDVDIQPAVG